MPLYHSSCDIKVQYNKYRVSQKSAIVTKAHYCKILNDF